MLTSLPLFGKAYVVDFHLDGDDKKRSESLKTFLSKPKYSTNKSTYLSWAKYFNKGEGMNSIPT